MGKLKFGELLVQRGLIEREELDRALSYQKKHGGKIGEILVEQGLLSEREVTDLLSTQLKMPKVYLDVTKIKEDIVCSLPKDICVKYDIIPFKREGNRVWVAMEDPLNALALEQIKMETNIEIKPVLAAKNEVENALSFFFSASKITPDSIEDYSKLSEVVSAKKIVDFEVLERTIEESYIKQYVNFMFSEAKLADAAEMHIEKDGNISRVRFRVHGILEEKFLIPGEYHFPIVSRIKKLAELDIRELENSQSGKVILVDEDGEINCTLTTVPALKGENLMVQFLIQDQSMLTLEHIGFSDEDIKYLAKQLRSPSGLILVAGATAVQKTLILYSLLQELNSIYRKIVTIEKLAHYEFPIITQIQLQPKKGMDFERTFSLALEQDPDVLFIDEITDEAVLQQVTKIAASGKLILTSIPGKDTFNAVKRLTDMGVKPYLISEIVNFVISYRKLRKLCPQCKEGYQTRAGGNKKMKLYKSPGCEHCKNRGYIGTTEIYELLKGDILNTDSIPDYSDLQKIKEAARKDNMRTLWQKGFILAKKGVVSIEEVYRAIR